MGSLEGLAHSNSYYVPKSMVTNDMSVVPKISEVCEFLLRNKFSLAFITETWLQSSIATQSYVGTVRPIIMVAFACKSMLKFDTNDWTLFRPAPSYKSNVEHMKKENPKVWWKDVKRLCGFNSNSGKASSDIHIEGIENLTDQELANAINEAFLEPLEEYRQPQPLTKLRIDEDTPELPEVSDMRIFKLLTGLNPSKGK